MMGSNVIPPPRFFIVPIFSNVFHYFNGRTECLKQAIADVKKKKQTKTRLLDVVD